MRGRQYQIDLTVTYSLISKVPPELRDDQIRALFGKRETSSVTSVSERDLTFTMLDVEEGMEKLAKVLSHPGVLSASLFVFAEHRKLRKDAATHDV